MPGPFGIDVALVGVIAEFIAAALDLLAAPPEWLTAVEDPALLRADLQRSVPELAAGSLTLFGCKFKRARMEDGTWNAICRLDVGGPDGEERREVDVRGTLFLPPWAAPAPSVADGFATDGWHCYLPGIRLDLGLHPTDAALPALASLTDAERARALLEDALRRDGEGLADLQLAGCTPKVMRHKEGRCTLRYELAYDPAEQRPHWPTSVVAKVYEGDEGSNAYEGMRGLWASPVRTSPTVAIAEPLAHLPDLHVMVQGVVAGEGSLKELLKPSFAAGLDAGVDALSPIVRKVGRGLAEVHDSGAPGGPTVTWEAELADAAIAVEQLTGAVPALSGSLQPLVAALGTAALIVPADPLVPSHRSFRPAQVLVDGGDIAFIDFDGFCQAEPGLDLALFRSTLCDLSLRALEKGGGPQDAHELERRLARLDELCAAFLAGYEEVRPVSRARLALWDVLTTVSDIFDCWRKIKFEHLERRMVFLRRQLGLRPAAGGELQPNW